LCAYTAVGTDSEVAGMVAAGDDVPIEVAEAPGWLAGLVDRRCQTTSASKRMHPNMRTARRPRIPTILWERGVKSLALTVEMQSHAV
jgi:hypothetical protein